MKLKFKEELPLPPACLGDGGGILSSISSKGFSLIELMIVITIVGILASIAVPTYRGYIADACRNDAKSSLENLANEQFQHYFIANNYADMIADLPVSVTSPEGHYTLSTARIADDLNTFVATAKPAADNDCLPDADFEYRIFHSGVKDKKLSSATEWEMGWD